ncbi:6249_t:CDS:2 [Funneliformis geosporum]|nr:6249_t:CDS:2 [Funneliformis geosporum]
MIAAAQKNDDLKKSPEVINGKGYTFASDIYSIGMLMWEILSGQPPFANYDHEYELAINLIKGIRPPIVQGTPIEYKNLMIKKTFHGFSMIENKRKERASIFFGKE